MPPAGERVTYGLEFACDASVGDLVIRGDLSDVRGPDPPPGRGPARPREDGYNAGVEVGQLLGVAAAVPALGLVRGKSWETRLIQGASGAVLLAGLVLFVARALL